MLEISRGPGWSRKSVGKKIAEWTAGFVAATGVLVGAEKAREVIDRDPDSDRPASGLTKQPDAVSFPPRAEEIKSEDRPKVQAPPPPDFDFPNPEVWLPQTQEEAVAYRQLAKVALERFHDRNLPIIKTVDPDHAQEGKVTWFHLKNEEESVNVRIFQDGSFLLKSIGDLDNDVVVEAGDLVGRLEDKLALSSSYQQFRSGQISEETFAFQMKRLGLPERQSFDERPFEVSAADQD